MVPSFPIKNLIPIKAVLILFFVTWFLCHQISVSCANKTSIISNSKFLAMKVHPLPKKRTLPNSTETQMGTSKTGTTHQQKKLRRLPHIFSRVLELPLKSDADVLIEESSDWFRFVFPVTEKLCGDGVRAHAIEIHPGVVKIVVKGSGGGVGLPQSDEMKLDMWRYRLPASTRPDKATAVCVGGELVVTVPKGGEVQKKAEDGEIWGGVGRLVLVQ